MGSLTPAVPQQSAIDRQDAVYAARQLARITTLAQPGAGKRALREIYFRCCMVIWTTPKPLHGRFYGIAKMAKKGLERA